MTLATAPAGQSDGPIRAACLTAGTSPADAVSVLLPGGAFIRTAAGRDQQRQKSDSCSLASKSDIGLAAVVLW